MNHINTSLRNIRRSPFQAMAAMSVLALTFFVTTLIAILVYSSSQVISYFETRPQIIAFLKDSVDQESVAAKAGFLTPVPGGIGPLTVALLLKNVYLASRSRS